MPKPCSECTAVCKFNSAELGSFAARDSPVADAAARRDTDAVLCQREAIGRYMLVSQCHLECVEDVYHACTYSDSPDAGLCVGWKELVPGACRNVSAEQTTARWLVCKRDQRVALIADGPQEAPLPAVQAARESPAIAPALGSLSSVAAALAPGASGAGEADGEAHACRLAGSIFVCETPNGVTLLGSVRMSLNACKHEALLAARLRCFAAVESIMKSIKGLLAASTAHAPSRASRVSFATLGHAHSADPALRMSCSASRIYAMPHCCSAGQLTALQYRFAGTVRLGESVRNLHCRLIHWLQLFGYAQSGLLFLAMVAIAWCGFVHARFCSQDKAASKLRWALRPLVYSDVFLVFVHFLLALTVVSLYFHWGSINADGESEWAGAIAIAIMVLIPGVVTMIFAVMESSHLPERSKMKLKCEGCTCRCCCLVAKDIAIGWLILVALTITVLKGFDEDTLTYDQARDERGRLCHGGGTLWREASLTLVPTFMAGLMAMLADCTKKDCVFFVATAILTCLFTIATVASSLWGTNKAEFAVLGTGALHALLLSALSWAHNAKQDRIAGEQQASAQANVPTAHAIAAPAPPGTTPPPSQSPGTFMQAQWAPLQPQMHPLSQQTPLWPPQAHGGTFGGRVEVPGVPAHMPPSCAHFGWQPAAPPQQYAPCSVQTPVAPVHHAQHHHAGYGPMQQQQAVHVGPLYDVPATSGWPPPGKQ